MTNRIDVFAKGKKVGILALTKERKVAFQYSDEWIQEGFSINPFKLPLSKEIFYSNSPYFYGLFGVFADSLPDSYGELLLERYLKSKSININELNCLDRLAYVGSSGMGMFEYIPDMSEKTKNSDVDFDSIQKDCNLLLDHKEVSDINSLYSLGGSSGGARPKSLINYQGEEYIVKFASKFDPKNIAELEYKYMSLAKEVGINIPEIKIVKTKVSQYFLIKRFDRKNNSKIHMITAAGLLECDFRAPSLDYNDLIKLTRLLTNNESDVEEMFLRMVFNVFIDNLDDHAKNFSFIYDDKNKTYRLSPAYDITPGKTYYGEHTTSINGKGKNITEKDMLDVASSNRINISKAKEMIERCKRVLAK